MGAECTIMSICQVDASGAGKYAQQFSTGARRFCEAHPDENWHIGGVEVADGLALSVSFNGKPVGSGWPPVLRPTLTLDREVFTELENLRENRAGSAR
jgi:hypothetical protein